MTEQKSQHAGITDWHSRQAMVEMMIPLIGKLYREQHVICSIFDRSIINRSAINILQTHQQVTKIYNQTFGVRDILAFLEHLIILKPYNARIDIGRMLAIHQKQTCPLKYFLEHELADVIKQPVPPAEKNSRDVILYGFGRIGRLMARILIERAGSIGGLTLKAIVVRKSSTENDLQKRAALLRNDSIHGAFKGLVEVDTEQNKIIANGVSIQIIYADNPSQADYQHFGINSAIIVDNTGVWRDEKSLRQHLGNPCISKVLLTAPGKGSIKNIVYGINHDSFNDQDKIVSAASCTTNAVTPVLKLLHDRFSIRHGHMETVHAYTNDQNLIDNYHQADRRGRAATLNIVITETGAAKAVSKALPQLEGKLTSNAIRVPVPNVSLAVLNLHLQHPCTVESMNNFLRECSLSSRLHQQIAFSDNEDAVSSDFIGSRYTSIVDAKATVVKDNQCILYVWYDNEFGYTCQVNRVLQKMAGIMHKKYPVDTEVNAL